MIVIRPGSHVHRLITILAVTGEYPTSALHLLGNEKSIKKYVHMLESVQLFLNEITGEELRCRLITISGTGAGRTIRFHKSGLPVLNWIHPNALEFYLSAYYNHRFPGNEVTKDRNHRRAEAVAMCARAGIEFRPYLLPNLQNSGICRVVPAGASYYDSKDVKRIVKLELSKTAYTRMTGVLFTPGEAKVVYNLRNSMMKWNGDSEIKTRISITDIARMNARVQEVYAAVMFGWSYEVAMSMMERDAEMKRPLRFDTAYRQVHFIPQTEMGIRQLRMLLLPEWREKMLGVMFDDETRSYERGMFEYDAYVDGVYILTHFDGDLARLIRFREAMSDKTLLAKSQILCFEEQVPLLRECLPKQTIIRVLDMELLEEALGIQGQGGVI